MLFFIGMMLFAFNLSVAFGETDFSKYRVIIDRRPFGTVDAPPDPGPSADQKRPEPVPPPQLARYWVLKSMVEIPGLGIRVGLENRKSKQSHFLGIGDSVEGVKVLDADYVQEKALLGEGVHKEWISMAASFGKLSDTEETGNVSSSPSVPGVAARQAYSKRIASRRKALVRHRKVEPPKLKGEELKKHLRELNMQYIREGKPPLPIQLTTEEDDTLVKEGVLPSRE